MKLGFVASFVAVAACSAGENKDAASYNHALECEVLVAIVGGSHPGLSQSDLIRYSESRRSFSETAGSLGEKLGKTPQQIDEDRGSFVADLQSKVRGDSDETQKVIDQSERCLAEA